MGYKTEKVTFRGFQDHQIDARLERPEGEVKAYAIFAHCFTCSKDVHAATRISRALTNVGIVVLRFDFTGLGNSEGDFSNTNFTTNVGDLTAAYLHLTYHLEAPEILIGHSLGGAVVLASANSMPCVKMVATIGAPSDVKHLEHLFAKKIQQIETNGQADVELAGRSFKIKKQFLDDVRTISLENKISELTASLIVFHSPDDLTVAIENAYEIFKCAPQPKSFISLNGASHMLDKVEDSTFVARTLANWCERYLQEKKKNKAHEIEEKMLDESSAESFPASDSPGFISKSHEDRETHPNIVEQ